MLLRRRALLTSLVVAVPAAVLLTWAADRSRSRDLELAVERVVRSQVNEATRERCESDPAWFFTGPLTGRPSYGVFVPSSPEELEPRPRYSEQPFELFGYDERFIGSGPATPRFPQEFRAPMQRANETVVGPYDTDDGTGVQMAIATGWLGSRCQYLLGRMAAPPDQTSRKLTTFLSVFGLVAALALAALAPTILRIRRVSRHAHAAVADGYRSMAPERLKDELSSLVFIFNDAVTELQRRQGRIDDLDTALRRFVQTVDEEIAPAVGTIERRLGADVEAGAGDDATRAALEEAHGLALHVGTLAAANRLRLIGTSPARSTVDLATVAGRVVDRQRPFALVRQVAVDLHLPDGPFPIEADEALVECAVANVLDNAIRYNRSGGRVTVTLASDEHDRRFRLWIADDGPGVADEEFRGLTAVRRFRGDEHRARRPGAPGLGLAVAREVCDRFGLALDLKRPGAGGFEVEFSGARL